VLVCVSSTTTMEWASRPSFALQAAEKSVGSGTHRKWSQPLGGVGGGLSGGLPPPPLTTPRLPRRFDKGRGRRSSGADCGPSQQRVVGRIRGARLKVRFLLHPFTLAVGYLDLYRMLHSDDTQPREEQLRAGEHLNTYLEIRDEGDSICVETSSPCSTSSHP
jgi:hypothetical protein